MTRAKRYLYLTYADSYGGQRVRKPSPFIEEALGAQVRTKAIQPAVDSFAEAASAPPSREGDLAQYVPQLMSYSQLSTFETCPLKYKYSYVYRLPTKPERALVFGNILHRTFKDFYTGLAHGKPATYEALEKLLERNWSREGFATSDEVALQHDRALRIIERFFAENRAQFAPAKHLEKSFIFKSGAHSFTGFIDRIDQLNDGTFEIIDYKTGAIASTKALQDRVAKDEQLSLYALAAREVLNLDVSKFTLYFVEQGMRASAPRSPAQLEVAEAKFAATAHKIQHSDFVATPGKQICSMCAYRNLCPFAAD